MDSIIPNIITAQIKQKESEIEFKTDLTKSLKLSEQFDCQVYLKREDHQQIRLFKMRGVFNKFINLTMEQRARGVVCVSDGNHAQAVAFFCNYFKVKGTCFLPEVVFSWKMELCKKYGKQWVTIVRKGDSVPEAEEQARKYCEEQNCIFIHPYNDQQIIEGNATMALEILDDIPGELDYLFIPIGGGGLAAGVATYVKSMSPQTKIIGVEPEGAASLTKALAQGKPTQLESKYNRFCDGSAVALVGDVTFPACQKYLDKVMVVPEGRLATTILSLYNQGIVVEPAGALGVSVLDKFAKEIKGKKVCCIITGGTVDLSRFDDFKEMSLLHEGLKYFFLITFPLKPGILKSFVTFCLGPEDELSHIQFHKKNNRERGPALVAIEVPRKENIKLIMERMEKMNLAYQNVNDSRELYVILI